MTISSLTLDSRLSAASRVPWTLSRAETDVSLAELGLLLGIGIATACARCLVNLNLGLPGHSIVLIVLPIAFGTALVRRRCAGTVMGVSAAATAASFRFFAIGHVVGPGALTSLAVTGIAFDLWMAILRREKSVYPAWVFAAVTANLIAFAVRAVTKLTGVWQGVGIGAVRPAWFARAVVSYSLCALIAGLLSAWICFKFRADDGAEPHAE